MDGAGRVLATNQPDGQGTAAVLPLKEVLLRSYFARVLVIPLEVSLEGAKRSAPAGHHAAAPLCPTAAAAPQRGVQELNLQGSKEVPEIQTSQAHQ